MAPIDLRAIVSAPHPEWGKRDLASAMKKAGIPAMGLCVYDAGDSALHTLGCDPADRFQVAPLSQTVFALLVLRLAQENKLDLHQDVAPLAPQGLLIHPRYRGGITLAQLLSHSAGLGLPFFPGYPAQSPLPDTLQSLLGQKPAANPALRRIDNPGVRSEYSCGGYLLAQWIVEKLTGQPLETLAYDMVFAPLGMDHSTFAPEPEGSVLPGHGHFTRRIRGEYYRLPQGAACGLWCSLSDAAKLLSTLGRDSRFLSPELRACLLTPYHHSSFSMGLQCDTEGGIPYVQCGGGSRGYQMKLRYFPEDDRGFFMIANAHSAFRVLVQTQYVLYQSLSWPYMPREEEPKRRKPYADQI